MRAMWVWGGALTVLGLAVVIGNRILLVAEPDRWGGPNIGGGALLLLAVAAVIAGAVFVIVGFGYARGLPAPPRVLVAFAAVGLVITYVLTAGDRTSPTSARAAYLNSLG